MLFWFVGTAVATVWVVFHDPRFDWRTVAAGALLPELDVVFGGARVMHSLAFSVALMAAVMGVTVGRRRLRQTLLGLPIGTFLHLVFDGVWNDARVFWWPFGGLSFDGARLPSAARGWWNVPLEVAGVALIVWFTTQRADSRAPRTNRPQRTRRAAGPDRRTARRARP